MRLDQLPEGVPEGELVEIFVEASKANIAQMRAALEALGAGPSFPDLATLHRVSHNMKGSSYQFGFPAAGDVAYAMERMTSRMLQQGGSVRGADRSLLLEAVGEIERLLGEIAAGGPLHDTADLCRRLTERVA